MSYACAFFAALEVPEGTIVDILGNQQYNLTKFLDLIKSVGLDRNYANPSIYCFLFTFQYLYLYLENEYARTCMYNLITPATS